MTTKKTPAEIKQLVLEGADDNQEMTVSPAAFVASSTADDYAMAMADGWQELSSSSLSTFSSISFQCTGLSEKGAQALGAAMPHCNFVGTRWDLRFNRISPGGGIEAIARGCASLTPNGVPPSLQVLLLQGNPLGSLAVKAFADHVPLSLVELDLSDTGIDNDGASYIGELLRNTQTLRILDLGYNDISDTVVIGAGLATCPLHKVHLTGNEITDDGVPSLARAILHNRQLIELSLSGNAITDVGGHQLLTALAHNGSMVSFDAEDGVLPDNMSEELQHDLQAFCQNVQQRRQLRAQRLSLVLLDFSGPGKVCGSCTKVKSVM